MSKFQVISSFEDRIFNILGLKRKHIKKGYISPNRLKGKKIGPLHMIHEKTTANDRIVHRSPSHCPLPACYRDACKQDESQEKGVLYAHLINFTKLLHEK